MVGIPYARTIEIWPYHEIVTCPMCGLEIALCHRKDGESFARTEYQEHYAAEHEGQDPYRWESGKEQTDGS